MACDADEECKRPTETVKHMEGETLEQRAHTFSLPEAYLRYHPECCPGQVAGDPCFNPMFEVHD